LRSSLSDLQIRKAKPKDKSYKLQDGGGMYLLITPAGGKLWRIDYRFAGRRKTLSIGPYPVIPLAEAREKLLKVKQWLASGIDPGAEKKRLQGLDEGASFSEAALSWYEEKKPTWSETHAARLKRYLEIDLFPSIGRRSISSIQSSELEIELKRIAIRSPETAAKVKTACHGIWNHAIRKGWTQADPLAVLQGILPPVHHKHMAALTDPRAVGALMRAIDGFDGHFVTKCALRLAPLVFVRPGELRKAEWTEIDLKRAKWNIPAEKMKMREPHLVPLARQAVEVFDAIQPLTGRGKYVFPCRRSENQPMSNMAINAALRRMGYSKEEITGHGFRAMARTLLQEVLRFSPDAIEAQLAHVVPDRLGRAYNRTTHLEERTRMMQAWADYLDGLKAEKA
jgi:integrase